VADNQIGLSRTRKQFKITTSYAVFLAGLFSGKN
jgi:hypothetical protein